MTCLFFFGKSHASKLGPKDWEVYWYTGYTLHVVQRGTGKFSNCCLCMYTYIYICITHTVGFFSIGKRVFFCWSSNSYYGIEVASHDSWYYYPCHNSQKLSCRCCRPQTIHSHTSVGCVVKMPRKHNNCEWCVFACEVTNSEKIQKPKNSVPWSQEETFFQDFDESGVRLWVHNTFAAFALPSLKLIPVVGEDQWREEDDSIFSKAFAVSFSECICMGQPIGFP